MKPWPLVLSFLWLATGGCAGGGDPDPLRVQVEALRDRACACSTVACAKDVQRRLGDAIAARRTPDGRELERVRAAIGGMDVCMTAVALRTARAGGRR
jgi:hypothetical protein